MSADFDDQVFDLGVRFGRSKIAEIAAYIEWWCRRRGPTGILGDDYGARHLWDEYCFDQRDGPSDALRESWSYDLKWLAHDRYKRMTSDEQAFLMLAAHFDAAGTMRDMVEPFLFNASIFEDAVIGTVEVLTAS